MTTVAAKKNVTFTNWANTFQCTPLLTFTPTTEAEVLEAISRARQDGRRLRAVGAGHSPSDLACTTDYLLRTEGLDRLLSVDRERKEVTVEGGMRLHDLHIHLEKHGLALSNLGSISDQAVAGIVATATHGTGYDFGVLSTLVQGMRIATADGRLVDTSATENAELFHAAQCHLGCLGVVVRVTLRCEAAFRLEATERVVPFELAMSGWEGMIRSAEHVRLWWYPHTENCLVWRADRTEKPETERASHWLWDSRAGFHLYQGILFLLRGTPSLIPRFTERFFQSRFGAAAKKGVEGPVCGREVGPSHRVFNFDCLFPQYVNEWAVPLDRAPEALEKLKRWIEASGLKVHFPIEVRIGAPDDIWLSPAYGQRCCWIGVIMYRPFGKATPYKAYWKGYEDIMQECDGRPHWAKAHRMGYEELRRVYPRLDDFMRVRAEMDGGGMFLNDYLQRHLFPREGGSFGLGASEEVGRTGHPDRFKARL